MARKAIIILGSSATALGVARNAYSRGLLPIVFDTTAGIATKSARAQSIVLEGAPYRDVLDHLIELGQKCSSYLIATSDGWLRFIVQYRVELDRAYKFVFHSDNDALAICLQKQRFAIWCRKQGLNTPEFYTREELRDVDTSSAKYPLLIRPAGTVHGERGRNIPKAIEVQDARELRHWLERYDAERLEPFVCESLLGQELTQYSVALARVGGEMISFVSRKIRPSAEYCAVGSYVELCRNEEAERLARKIFDLLDYYGIGEVEIQHSGETGKYYLIEVNARPWLQYSLSVASGHDFLQFMLDPETHDKRSEVKEGEYWLDFRNDLYICFSRHKGMVRKGKVSFSEYAASLFKANVYTTFAFNDQRPFWYDIKEMAKLILGRRP